MMIICFDELVSGQEAGEAVVVTEADGYTLRHVNEQFENLTGYVSSAAEPLNQSVWSLFESQQALACKHVDWLWIDL